MTETKHTPAPWGAFENRYGIYVRIPNNEVIAQMVGDFNREDKRNNANLIAAAPNLLDALVEMIELCTFIAPDIHSNLIDNAHAAIAKARGET